MADIITKKTASSERIRRVLSTGPLNGVLDGVDVWMEIRKNRYYSEVHMILVLTLSRYV